MAQKKRRIKRLAIKLAKLGHPKPWRWAKKIINGNFADLLEECDEIGWDVYFESYYCYSCQDYHDEAIGLVTPAGLVLRLKDDDLVLALDKETIAWSLGWLTRQNRLAAFG